MSFQGSEPRFRHSFSEGINPLACGAIEVTTSCQLTAALQHIQQSRPPYHRAKFAQLGDVGLGMPPKKSLYGFGGRPMLGFGPQDPLASGLMLELRNVTA